MQDLSVYFRALGDRKRLDILEFLAGHEQVTVTDLGDQLRLSQPLISWHLRKLRKIGVVKTRRSGRQVWCSLDRAVLRRYQAAVGDLLGLVESDAEDRSDPSVTLRRTAVR